MGWYDGGGGRRAADVDGHGPVPMAAIAVIIFLVIRLLPAPVRARRLRSRKSPPRSHPSRSWTGSSPSAESADKTLPVTTYGVGRDEEIVMTTRRVYVVALAAASLALVGTIGAATACAVSAGTVATTPSPAAADWNDGPGWTMDPDSMMGGTWGASTDFTVSADQARVESPDMAQFPGARRHARDRGPDADGGDSDSRCHSTARSSAS